MPQIRYELGHVIDSLRAMAPGSVHMVATSSPYWAARRYPGQQKYLWGGKTECEHEWNAYDVPRSATGDAPRDLAKNAKAHNEMIAAGPAEPWLRCSKCDGEFGALGQEEHPSDLVRHLVSFSMDVWRVLRDDGTFWFNIGDCFVGGGRGKIIGYQERMGEPLGPMKVPPGLKRKDKALVPQRLAIALQDAGWYVRQDIIWAKAISYADGYCGSVKPEPAQDRPINAHEYVYLLSKKPDYYYDRYAIAEPAKNAGHVVKYGENSKNAQTKLPMYPVEDREVSPIRNSRDVWAVMVSPLPGFSHTASWPTSLVEKMILAGTSEYGVCAECGSQYKRIVQKTHKNDEEIRKAQRPEDWFNFGSSHVPGGTNDGKHPTGLCIKTVGWEKTCECGTGEVVRATVLDPFAGSGTSLLVAEKLGRNAIGFDCAEQYYRDYVARRAFLIKKGWFDAKM